MNWRRVRLRTLGLHLALLGAMAGAWAGLLAVGALILAQNGGLPLLRTYLPVLVLGLVAGMLLAPLEEVLNRHPRRALRAALFGALLSGVLGAIAFGTLIAVSRLQFHTAPIGGDIVLPQWLRWIWFSGFLAAVAMAVGFASGLGARSLSRGLRRALRGLVGGALAGFPAAALISALGYRPTVLVAAVAVWGAWVAWVVFWVEQRGARRWLRLVTPPGEDRVFPLEKHQITLGKVESNDIPLLWGEEIYPHHCKINWAGDHYEIIDDEQGGIVLVNFRQIQEHPLKPGDLVKIGSALLQYDEVPRT